MTQLIPNGNYLIYTADFTKRVQLAGDKFGVVAGTTAVPSNQRVSLHSSNLVYLGD
jgi:hypothetical protein